MVTSMANTVFQTPIGPVYLSATDQGLRNADFASGSVRTLKAPGSIGEDTSTASEAEAILAESVLQINQYFDGSRRSFDLPLDIEGTAFQRQIWQSIAEIPFGETASYAQIANAAGACNAYRAAGTACGANRLVIVIPCHRVVGAAKTLGGFGGGLPTKVWLLEHEGSLHSLRETRVQPSRRPNVIAS